MAAPERVGASADVVVTEAEREDVGELWAVQRAAYVDEAQIYGDPFVLPLTESRGQLLRAVDGGAVLLKAVCGGRIVGGARGKAVGSAATVARLFVAPDRRREGIGSALLAAMERRLLAADPPPAAITLSTGHGGRAVPELLRAAGYRQTHREALHEHLTLLHFRKEAPAALAGGPGEPVQERVP